MSEGDRLEDANAAKIANVVFFYASWGYGSPLPVHALLASIENAIFRAPD